MGTSSKADNSETKTFSGFFIAFVKSTLSLEYSQENNQSRSLIITEIIN